MATVDEKFSPFVPSSPTVSISEESRDSFSDVDEKHALLHQVEEVTDIDVDRSTIPLEDTIHPATKLTYIIIYFALNLVMTLSNKAVMQVAKFPWLLTTFHTFATALGCAVFLWTGHLKTTRLSGRDNLVLVLFSSLFALNIAVSNVSLALVSVAFHSVLRATCPIATIIIYRVFYGRSYSMETYYTMLPLIVGVALATYGDYDFTFYGFSLTFLGVVLASVKSIATNRLLTGSLKLPPLELLFRMSPLAALQCLGCAFASGEVEKAQIAFASAENRAQLASFGVALGLNVFLAFVLNISSFQTNKMAGALTISVGANVKQCLTILLGIILFGTQVGALNGAGMFVTIVGAVWYSKVELAKRRKASMEEPSVVVMKA